MFVKNETKLITANKTNWDNIITGKNFDVWFKSCENPSLMEEE